ncbi:hypothetical protein Ahy_B06g085831 isoform C [Arachis hypogaea]|nr:hypothetical protein Ahy_B06g085831 isoform C [Arachis hypogaea]
MWLFFYPCRYTTYGPEYVYPQSMYNPYMGQHYLQIYGVPGAVNTTIYPYGQVGQAMPSGHGYTAMQGYTIPGHQIVPYGGSNVNAMSTSPMPAIQTPYPSGDLEELLHQFQANRNLLFLLLLHSLCKAVVLTKPLGEGANKVPLVCSRTRAVELLLEWRASNLALQVIILHSRGTFACFASSRLRSYIVMLTRLCISWLQMAKETGICGLLLFHLDVYISVFIPDTAITQKELW